MGMNILQQFEQSSFEETIRMDVGKLMHVDVNMQADTMNFVHQSVDTQQHLYVQQNHIGITAPGAANMLTHADQLADSRAAAVRAETVQAAEVLHNAKVDSLKVGAQHKHGADMTAPKQQHQVELQNLQATAQRNHDAIVQQYELEKDQLRSSYDSDMERSRQHYIQQNADIDKMKHASSAEIAKLKDAAALADKNGRASHENCKGVARELGARFQSSVADLPTTC